MKYVLLAITGVIGGLLGGMGMGGGTLLIPALTIFFNLEQKLSQTVNLVSFVPMATVALVIHCKNKMIKRDGLFLITVCALVFSVGGSLLAKLVSGNIQTKLFGGFLTALSVFQFIMIKRSEKLKNKQSKNEKNE